MKHTGKIEIIYRGRRAGSHEDDLRIELTPPKGEWASTVERILTRAVNMEGGLIIVPPDKSTPRGVEGRQRIAELYQLGGSKAVAAYASVFKDRK